MFKKNEKLTTSVGRTVHCVYCLKKLQEDGYNQIGCGHLKRKDGKIVMAQFCNQDCLSSISWTKPGWCGSPYLDIFGIYPYTCTPSGEITF